MRISAVPYEGIDVVWDDAKRWIEPALKRSKNRYNIEDIREYIEKKLLGLWVAFNDDNEIKAAITTRGRGDTKDQASTA